MDRNPAPSAAPPTISVAPIGGANTVTTIAGLISIHPDCESPDDQGDSDYPIPMQDFASVFQKNVLTLSPSRLDARGVSRSSRT